MCASWMVKRDGAAVADGPSPRFESGIKRSRASGTRSPRNFPVNWPSLRPNQHRLTATTSPHEIIFRRAVNDDVIYDFVRLYLCAREGTCSRDELLAALLAEPRTKERLSRSRGFTALLNNMRHSGDIVLDGAVVRPSPRTFRRLRFI
jgi:hypothetical protein